MPACSNLLRPVWSLVRNPHAGVTDPCARTSYTTTA
jgi:hypothetical protein